MTKKKGKEIVVEAEVVEETSDHQKRFDVVAIEENLPAAFTPMTMIEKAMASGADVEQLEKFWNLQVKYEEREAKKSFIKAMAAFKAECPVIPRTAKGQSGLFSDLADIAGVVDSRLGQHGLSYRWQQEQANKELTVTCIVTHKDGHSESTPLTGPLDASGNKNAIQSIGSSNTYLLRYTLIASLGLATKEISDDDGRDAGQDPVQYIDDEQWRKLDTLLSQIEDPTVDQDYFCKCFRLEGMDLLPADMFKKATETLNKKIKEQTK